jgi:CRISPR-associated protein Csm1
MKLFKPKGSGDDTKRCSVCKEENKIKDTNEKKCIYCSDFEKLTKRLKDFGHDNEIKIRNIKNLKIFNGFFEIPLNIQFENNAYNLPDDNGNLDLPYKIWSIAFPLENKKDNKDEKEIKEFSKLANDSEGAKKLAILKMDVDNLGKIITRGLGKYATLSRLSTLSSMLTLFFTGYIPYLIKSNDKYRNSIYLTYSGGDDTLIVGAWDKVWDLAKKINDKFRKFVCDNPDITLSAGVVLVNPKFEYRKGVYLAEDELENAKENKVKINGEEKEKNSVSIFGHALRWEDIEKERRLEDKFIKAIANTNKKRIVHLSQKVHSNLEKALKDKASDDTIRINIPYLWRMKYYLYRNYKNGNAWKYVEFIDKYLSNIEKNIIGGKMEFNFNDILIASRIAELKSRTEGNNE